jgi:pyruvate dehydrogenase E2 component (dihydrolipoamide acetyltransferase)
MAHPILMPKPGQMTEECVLVAWHKAEGDPVHRGDVLFEIETDKSVMEVESFDEGVLLKRYVAEGQTVPVNSVCGYVGAAGEAVPDVVAAAAAAAPAVPQASPSQPQMVPPAPLPSPSPGREATVPSSPPASPPGLVAAAVPAAPVTAALAVAPQGAGEPGADRLRISPRASRLAAESGVDPRTVSGTGPLGRITERDVRTAIDLATARAASAPAAGPPPAFASAQAPSAPIAPPAAYIPAIEPGEEEPWPLSRMRRVIAERLTLSHTTIPRFTITVAVDMTALLQLRQELQAAGTSLSVTDFILSATAQTLVEFPDVNSRTDGTSVWPRHRVHLGLAVSVPAGLVVPVIRDADRRSLRELHDRAAALAGGARDGTLPVDDLTGSTFTVSNLGMFGVEEFSAIINPGEAAILAVSSVLPTPVAVGTGVTITVRQVMKLTLSADHRLVDGALAARFLNAVRRRLEDAASFRNEVIGG